jgi:glycosyltransferase involved in cell wall biosynthesis
VWLRQSHDAIAAARALGLPVVISPRGMLEPWALAYHAWKKRLAWWLYQRRDLRGVTAFHATAEMEAESIRRLGFRQPIIVLPNGVAMPAPTEHRRSVAEPATREALFLSRIHPKKGIDLLIEAWARLRPAGWRLTIAGNDEAGHAAVVERRIREAGLGEAVRYVGPAYGADKERLFRAAHLFVLPSHSENFGIVVAEALAYGMPVLTTTGTPWAELVSRHCGWHVAPTTDAIADALRQAVTLSVAELTAMGAAGRQLVVERYQWDAIARQFGAAYAALGARDADALAALPFVRHD